MKKTLCLILTLVMLSSLCAFGALADDVTLNAIFMKQAGYSEDDVLAMTQAFTEATGIQVNPTFVAYEELAPKILTSAASGGYDVILGDCIWPAQFAKAGLVLDVTDRVSALDLDDIYQGALDATRYEGKYYGMPWLNDVKEAGQHRGGPRHVGSAHRGRQDLQGEGHLRVPDRGLLRPGRVPDLRLHLHRRFLRRRVRGREQPADPR